MKSKNVLVATACAAGIITVVAVVAAVFELWWLVTAAIMLVLSAGCLAAVDANRRVILLRAFVIKDLKRTRAELTGGSQKQPAERDVLGAVRLLQAQYTARLDRLQGSIENALGQDTGSPPSPQPAQDRPSQP